MARAWQTVAVTLFDVERRAPDERVGADRLRPAQVKLVVGLRRHRLQRLRRAVGPTGRAHGRRGARRRHRQGAAATRCGSRARVAPTPGVHAWGQVASFPSEPGLDPWRLQTAVTSMLGPEVVIRSAELVDPQFDARHAARVADLPLHDLEPAGARPVSRSLHVVGARAARPARAATRRPTRSSASTTSPRSVARVRKARRRRAGCSSRGGSTRATACCATRSAANAFCWQLVRSIVGTLVEVGTRQAPAGRDDGDPPRPADRSAAGQLAPPRGLCLWEVGY